MSNLIVSQINGGPTGVINAIINGNFGVNQRGVSGTVTLAAGVYGHDRWKAGASGCTYTFATLDNVTTLTISSGSLIQVIEGLNLGSGTYTLSWTGTAQGKIGAGSYAGSGVTGAAVGGTNLNIEFNTGTVSLVQFEQGSVATPFERRPFGTELALCQRYFWTSTKGTYNAVGAGIFNTTSSTIIYAKHPVSMRAVPTFSFAGLLYCHETTSSFQVTAVNSTYAGLDSSRLDVSTLSGASAGRGTVLFTNNTSADYLQASAEL